MNATTLLRMFGISSAKRQDSADDDVAQKNPARGTVSPPTGSGTARSAGGRKALADKSAADASARSRSDAAAGAQAPSPYAYGRRNTSPEAMAQSVAVELSEPAPSEMPSLATIERDYPHVMRQLRAAWKNPREFDRVIADLLIPARSGRKGFPPEMLVALNRLREYYALYSVGARGRVAPPWPKDGTAS